MPKNIVCIASIFAATLVSAQAIEFPEGVEVFDITEVNVRTKYFDVKWEHGFINDGLSVAGFTGPARLMVPGGDDHELFVVEGPGIRRFKLEGDSEPRLIDSLVGWLGDRSTGLDSDLNIGIAYGPQGGGSIHEFHFQYNSAYPHAIFQTNEQSPVRFDYVYSLDTFAEGTRYPSYPNSDEFYSRNVRRVENPYIPVRLSTGQKVWLCFFDGGVAILDISATDTNLLSWASWGGTAKDYVIADDKLYALLTFSIPDHRGNSTGNIRRALAIVDIANSHDATLFSLYTLDHIEAISHLKKSAFAVDGGRAYFVSDPKVITSQSDRPHMRRTINSRLEIVVVSNPGTPQKIYDGRFDTHEHGDEFSDNGATRFRNPVGVGDLIVRDGKLTALGFDGFSTYAINDSGVGQFYGSYPTGYGTPYRGSLHQTLEMGDQLYTLMLVSGLAPRPHELDISKTRFINDVQFWEQINAKSNLSVNNTAGGAMAIARYNLSGGEPVVTWQRATSSAYRLTGDTAWARDEDFAQWADISDPANPKYDFAFFDENFSVPEIDLHLGRPPHGDNLRIQRPEGGIERGWLVNQGSAENPNFSFLRDEMSPPVELPYIYTHETIANNGDNSQDTMTIKFNTRELLENGDLIERHTIELTDSAFDSGLAYSAISENRLAVAANTRGGTAWIIDLQDGANPRIASTITLPSENRYCMDVGIMGEMLAIETAGGFDNFGSANGYHRRIELFDISDINNPIPQNTTLPHGDYSFLGGYRWTYDGFYTLQGTLLDFATNWAHVSQYNSGTEARWTEIQDFSNPFAPVSLSRSTLFSIPFDRDRFNGKYFTGTYLPVVAAASGTLILRPDFIDFPPMNVYPSPQSHRVAWQSGTLRSAIAMDESTIATTWNADLIAGAEWLTMNKEHATVTPSDGGGQVAAGALTFEFGDNPTPFSRSAQIHVRAASPEAITSTIAIQQLGLPMVVSPLEVTIPPEGGSSVLTIDIAGYPAQWYVAIEDEAPWVSMDDGVKSGEGNGSFTVTVSENDTEQPRIAMARIWTDFGHQATIPIQQRSYVPGELAVSNNVIRIDSDLQIVEIDVTNIGETPIAWDAYVLLVNWVSLFDIRSGEPVRRIESTDSDTLTLFVRENTDDAQRRAILRIRPNDDTLPEIFVAIIQDGDFAITDADRDGNVSANDIQLIINAVITGDNSCDCADINGDGQVDAQDIQAIINAVLGMKALL